MAVTSYALHWAGAVGEMTTKERTYAAVYRIYTSDPLDGPAVIFEYVIANLPNPIAKTSYAYGNDLDSQAFCNRISAPKHVEGSATTWEITAHFSTNPTSGGGGTDRDGGPTGNPLDFRPDIQIGFVTVQRPVRLAKYQKGFTGAMNDLIPAGTEITPMSSAFGVFDPPLEKEVAMMRVSITTNTQTWDHGRALEFIQTVNRDELTLVNSIDLGYPQLAMLLTIKKRTAKLNDYKIVMKRETAEINGTQQTIDYLAVTTELLVDPSEWRVKVPDMDWHRAAKAGDPDGRGGTISMTDMLDGMARNEPIRGANGDLASRKVLLDGNGQPLDDQSPENAVLLEFEVYEEKFLATAPGIATVFS